MSVVLFFLAAIAAIVVWWLAGQRLTSRPWLEIGHLHDRRGPARIPPAKIGLGVFLAVVGALFSLSVSAYFMRMASSDWGALPLPGLLWFNTGILAAGSITLQWARAEAGRQHDEAARTGLLAALASGLAFLVGQLFAWRALSGAGYFLAENPANSFFYLLTGMHGLHILGGLIVLGRVTAHAAQAPIDSRTRLSIELCAIYWHFMLIVWVVLFALFAGWASGVIDFCRQLLT
ncbi:cytochrome-c oxidase [Sinorhizobium medicae]|uniref:Cytochrome c oxidase subunit III n=2 Tax=Sinorhizobium medicae TaxID=110321 RepID=A0A508WWF5_9HYPH|nr:cytochrome c oxidase subunit 3 [Sinorhizobium medicae]ABR61259.1 cytochrome c oxidase subunit III [Sinorhizobium medicae WSM419]MBO1943368.1 cytochrome c oxidase subunit 3 [Sinorhizobium medicae]MBO1959039.1 cytochrome c oxidase subunit 3 [Sinorhizobium medicae]MDX0405748.1 cytochrome-c oxidase [Sinorhizobium medicae]MDX0411268.1 cytochrome-c oxidase [Sinorhizobium medicae]